MDLKQIHKDHNGVAVFVAKPAHVYHVVSGPHVQVIGFQDGPIKEVGVNGLTNEALIAIVVDRLEHFNSGAFACRENALAITKLQEASHWLQHRTQARINRGVEGTHNV